MLILTTKREQTWSKHEVQVILHTQLSIWIYVSKEDFYIPVIKGHGCKRLKVNVLISYERKYDTKQVYLIQVWLNFTVIEKIMFIFVGMRMCHQASLLNHMHNH